MEYLKLGKVTKQDLPYQVLKYTESCININGVILLSRDRYKRRPKVDPDIYVYMNIIKAVSQINKRC